MGTFRFLARENFKFLGTLESGRIICDLAYVTLISNLIKIHWAFFRRKCIFVGVPDSIMEIPEC